MSTTDDTRSKLLEAAVIEFAEQGYDHATIRAICARADVNLNAVKYHYTDKQGLYVAAVRHAHAVAGHIEPPEPMGGSAEDRLRAFVEGMLTMALSAEHESVANQLLMMREMVHPSAATEEIVQAFIRPRFAELNDILAELLPEDTATMDRHLLALSVVGQCLHYKIGRSIDQMLIAPSEYKRFTVSRLTAHICDVILAAIDAKHQSPAERD